MNGFCPPPKRWAHPWRKDSLAPVLMSLQQVRKERGKMPMKRGIAFLNFSYGAGKGVVEPDSFGDPVQGKADHFQ